MRDIKEDMTKQVVIDPTEEMTRLLIQSGSAQASVALPATNRFAKALELPLRQGVLYGNIMVGDVFQPIKFAPNQTIEFPLDVLSPGTEKNHIAYTIPNHGRIPERHLEGNIITINTYELGNSIDWLLKFSQDGRWDIVNRAMKIFMGGFVKKFNDDAFRVLLAAGVERNVVVYDSLAAPGSFTKRLITLMQQVMRRNYGGNSTSTNRGRLTDLYMSPEALEDMRNWTLAEVDEVTRREIFTAQDGTINRIFGINLHDIDELGDGQQYQQFYLNELGGTLAAGDTELVIGLDLSDKDVFVMPMRQELQVFEDDNLHRQRRAGFYGWCQVGFSLMDSRRVLLASL